MRRSFRILAAGALLTVMVVTGACAARTHAEGRRVETVETVRSTEAPPPACGGVVSCSVDAVGDIVAFPFRIVGSAVDAVF